MDKLKFCASSLQTWGRGLARHFKDKIQACSQLLSRLQASSDPVSTADYYRARSQLNALLAQEEMYWKQRAKCHWLEGGDSNSRYFHAMASTRKRTNSIERIQDNSGIWRSTKDEINLVAVEYFSNIFQEDLTEYELDLHFIQPMISIKDNAQLTTPFSIGEFRQAAFQMHQDKSPGPNGFNPAFYQKFWPLVGNDLFLLCSRWLGYRPRTWHAQSHHS